MLSVTILGCGTSTGVPRLGGASGVEWGACDPSEPRNRRRRVAILIRHAKTTILVDTGPDLREQLLAAQVARLDAVIWTHDHADHTHGIDDLRPMRFGRSHPIPGYADSATLATLANRFGYVFAGEHGYPSLVTPNDLRPDQRIGSVTVRSTVMPHGAIEASGLRFEVEGVSIGYATDFSSITADMNRLFDGVDLLVVDALRRAPHPSHPDLEMVLDWLPVIRPDRTILTHMDHSMDYAFAGRLSLPVGVEPGLRRPAGLATVG